LNDGVWFVGKDAINIRYIKPAKAVRKHIEQKDKVVFKIDTSRGKQLVDVINEIGLYSLIISSAYFWEDVKMKIIFTHEVLTINSEYIRLFLILIFN